jgi:superfamily II DNA or RNA helicase
MDFFKTNYDKVRFPVYSRDEGVKGLYNAQLGAIHAIASHFTLSNDASLIVMPTGSGKTAVMMLTPFLLRSKRVLVLVPRVLLRQQLVKNLRDLQVLRSMGALEPLDGAPRVFEADSPIETAEHWQAMVDYDVVVGIPDTVLPKGAEIAQPPAGFFDLVLVDEAHHTPAETWNRVLETFPGKHVLFTATPFRKDQKKLNAKMIYTYPIEKAKQDGIFSDITYVPIRNIDGDKDRAIATKALEIFRRDAALGLEHRLMVRAGSIPKSKRLLKLYKSLDETLRIRAISSDDDYSFVEESVELLKNGDLDAVVCVDMLGEGFDLPQLKIGAIHDIYHSLAITLQFIGRFVRTTAPNTAAATFIAAESDISVEAEQLYKQEAAWSTLIPNLLNSAVKEVQQAIRAHEIATKFTAVPGPDVDAAIQNIAPDNFTPYHHVKVYKAELGVSIDNDIDLPSEYSIVGRRILESEGIDEVEPDDRALLLVTREVIRPRWSTSPILAKTEYDLIIVFYASVSKLLFICSSRKSDALYDIIAKALTLESKVKKVSQSSIQRVLRDLDSPEFFNIGMRNNLLTTRTEAYRIISGGTAHNAIRQSDGRLYGAGHAFGRAKEGNEKITLGYSTSGKIWSNKSSNIADLLKWCTQLSGKLSNESILKLPSGLAYLRSAQVITALPDPEEAQVIAATWCKEIYMEADKEISFLDDTGRLLTFQLLDFNLKVEPGDDPQTEINITLDGHGLQWPITFRLNALPHFTVQPENQREVTLVSCTPPMAFIDYINKATAIEFFFADGSSLCGDELSSSDPQGKIIFEPNQIEAVPWADPAVNVNIKKEISVEPGDTKRSIHAYLEERLAAGDYDLVFYDHTNGETADFITIKDTGTDFAFEFYHCKGSSEENTGNRVGDIYEVAGQVVKTCIWLSPSLLLEHIRTRNEDSDDPDTRKFIKPATKETGQNKLAELRGLLAQRGRMYKIYMVQPAISLSKLIPKKQEFNPSNQQDPTKINNLLSSANDYIIAAGCEPLCVLGSK